MRSIKIVGPIMILSMLACGGSAWETVELHNHHDAGYQGPISVPIPTTGEDVDKGSDGYFASGNSMLRQVDDRLEGYVQIGPGGTLLLEYEENGITKEGPLSLRLEAGDARLFWNNEDIGALSFDLVVLPLENPTPDHTYATAAFDVTTINWEKQDNRWKAKIPDDTHDVDLELIVHPQGFIDTEATVQRKTKGDLKRDGAYVALVMRVQTSAVREPRMRWNGEQIDGDIMPGPERFELNYNWSADLDWFAWKAEGLDWLWVNGLTKGNAIRYTKRWAELNHFFNKGAMLREQDALYFLTELASTSPLEGTKWAQSPRTRPLRHDRAIQARMRLAVTQDAPDDWETIQTRAYAGYRMARQEDERLVVDLGVPQTEYGMGYFPYSTMMENLHYYRVPGLNKETWWPVSAEVWERWESFKPQMQRDLRIIRWLGAEWVRLHHLHQLGWMDRDRFYDFMDWFTAECASLGMDVLVDSGGSVQWHADIAGRYKDTIKRIQVENEILIHGYPHEKAASWRNIYPAIKEVAPETEVFWTGYGNPGIFDSLDEDNIPYDRLGIHRYVYGEGETGYFSTMVTAMGGVATDFRKPVSFTEANWKDETHRPPEIRQERAISMYRNALEPRAIDTFYTFHFHETLSVNPMRSRNGTRHYEPFHMDRSPKPEVVELRDLVRKHAAADATVRQISINIPDTVMTSLTARTEGRISNTSQQTLHLTLEAECFDGSDPLDPASTIAAVQPSSLTLEPGETNFFELGLGLEKGALPGVRHVFVRARDESGLEVIGWGIFRKEGKPIFCEKPVLEEEKVHYVDGANILNQLDWTRELTVAFRQPDFEPVITKIAPLEGMYIIGNTLQTVTGKPIYMCPLDELSENRLNNDTVILIARNKDLPDWVKQPTNLSEKTGWIAIQQHDGRPWLIIGGETHEAVFAGAAEFTLRYWLDSPYSAMSRVGHEKGAGYGDVKRIGIVDMP